MGKAVILLSLMVFPAAVYFTLKYIDLVGTTGVIALLATSIFLVSAGLYAGLLGVKTDELSSKVELLLQPETGGRGNLIKAVCPVDHKQVVFVHVSSHRADAQPNRLDLFLGACGHEVHRGEIELEH